MTAPTPHVIYSADTDRKCGACQLCCKLVPVADNIVGLHKQAGERCKYQRFNKGCTIYHRRPFACAHYLCRWLMNVDTADLPRPDRCHYVLDPMPDFVGVVSNGVRTNVQTVQIWVDPDFPDAHRDPALRRYLLRRAQENIIGSVRYGSRGGIVLIPPPMSWDGQWHEHQPTATEPEHTFTDYQQAFLSRG